jgi:hypothetical protein
MGIQTGANVEVSIGSTGIAHTESGYEADTFVLIGGVESISEFGDTAASVTFTGLSDGRTQKLKGSRDAGNMTISMGFIGGDDGQEDLADAEADNTSANYSFKVEFSDGEIRYFAGQVGSVVESIGGADNVLMLNCEVRINTSIIKIAAP